MSKKAFRVTRRDPVPDGRGRTGGPRSEIARQLVKLEFGCCLEVVSRAEWATAAAAASYWGRKLGRKYKTAQMGEVLGIWRLS